MGEPWDSGPCGCRCRLAGQLQRREAAEDQHHQAEAQPGSEPSAARVRLRGEAVEDQRGDEREEDGKAVGEEAAEAIESDRGNNRAEQAKQQPTQAANADHDRDADSERAEFPTGLGLRGLIGGR